MSIYDPIEGNLMARLSYADAHHECDLRRTKPVHHIGIKITFKVGSFQARLLTVFKCHI